MATVKLKRAYTVLTLDHNHCRYFQDRPYKLTSFICEDCVDAEVCQGIARKPRTRTGRPYRLLSCG